MNGPESVEKEKNNDLKGQVISIIVLACILIVFWSMLDIALLTFIITFILYNIVTKLQKHVKKLSGNIFSLLVLGLVYIIFILLLIILCINLIPKIVEQFTELSYYIMGFDINRFLAALDPRISAVIAEMNVGNYIITMGTMISAAAARVTQFSINLFISLVLSFFLVFERDKVKEFGGRLETSKISFIYNYFMTYGVVFARTFGNVMKVQVTISLINSVISAVILWFMGFPSVFGLAGMMFCLGLVPVAGVVVSLIPLCTIAFMIGGVVKVAEVIIMILVLHAMEAYVLNPKLMANRVRLPVCFVFITLIVAEHYLGVWGLLIGVPIFIFLMTAFDVNYAIDKKKKSQAEP